LLHAHNKPPDGQIEKRHGERQQKDGFHIEEQEHQAEEIILRVKACLRLGERSDSAFVEIVFVRAAFDGREKTHPHAGQHQRSDGNCQCHREKQQDRQVGMVHEIACWASGS
jgi:hypothetical protein